MFITGVCAVWLRQASLKGCYLRDLIRRSGIINVCMVFNAEYFLPNYSEYLQIVHHLQVQHHQSGFFEETG